MHHFNYKDGVMHAEGVNLQTLAEDVGTPFYCYSSATLTRHYQVLDKAFEGTDHTICYAIKANYWSWKLNDISQGQDALPLWMPQLVMSIGTIMLAICFWDNLIRLVFVGDPDRLRSCYNAISA